VGNILKTNKERGGPSCDKRERPMSKNSKNRPKRAKHTGRVDTHDGGGGKGREQKRTENYPRRVQNAVAEQKGTRRGRTSATGGKGRLKGGSKEKTGVI